MFRGRELGRNRAGAGKEGTKKLVLSKTRLTEPCAWSPQAVLSYWQIRLTLCLHDLALHPLCMSGSYWGAWRGRTGCQLLELDQACRCSWAMVLTTGWVFNFQLLGRNGVCPRNQLLEGPGQMRRSAPVAGTESRVTARVLGADCRRSECCISPKPGVHVYLPDNSKLNSPARRRPQVCAGASGEWKICASIWGRLQVWDPCGTSMCWQWALDCTSQRVGDPWGHCVCVCPHEWPPVSAGPREGGDVALCAYVSPGSVRLGTAGLVPSLWQTLVVSSVCVSRGCVLGFPADWACRWERGSHIHRSETEEPPGCGAAGGGRILQHSLMLYLIYFKRGRKNRAKSVQRHSG